MFCSKCGTACKMTDRFCEKCGETLARMRSTPPIQRSRTPLIIAIMALVVALAGSGVGIFFFLQSQKEDKQVAKIIPDPVIEKIDIDIPQKLKEKTEIIQEAQGKVYTIFTPISQGSGFLISKTGSLATNAHVVAGFTEVIIHDNKGNTYEGRVTGISDRIDIAVIHVAELEGLDPLPMEFEEAVIGTEVIALGSPRGLENTASIGYLTGLNRDFLEDYHYEKVYQIDAQVSPGSSGGPLLDGKTGKVIGINSAVLNDDQSIAFSIPLYSIHDRLLEWVENPMTAEEIRSNFAYYQEYQDCWLDEDASANADPTMRSGEMSTTKIGGTITKTMMKTGGIRIIAKRKNGGTPMKGTIGGKPPLKVSSYLSELLMRTR